MPLLFSALSTSDAALRHSAWLLDRRLFPTAATGRKRQLHRTESSGIKFQEQADLSHSRIRA